MLLRYTVALLTTALLSQTGCGSDENDGSVDAAGGTAGAPGLGGMNAGGAPFAASGGLANGGFGGSPEVTASGGFTSAGGVGAAGLSAGGTTSAGGSPDPSAGGAATAGGGGAVPPGLGGSAGENGGASSGGAAPIDCSSQTLQPGETYKSLSVDGVNRSYLLHVPRSYTGDTPVPLVLDFHGILTNAGIQRAISGYAELSEREGFIVAFPEGIDAAWNVGPCCTASRTVDDVGFAKALVKQIESDGCIDAKRVHAVGYSMGGGMSFHLACHAADVFASVAPAAFDLLEENSVDCEPARPITVMTFRGTGDPIVTYAGGASNPPNGLPVTIHFLGAEATFQKWKEFDGCTGSPSPTGDGCQTYSQCEGGVEVTLCTAPGGGHVPGDAAKGWETLKKYPMP